MGHEIDGRSDIYSIGIVLFELLAGTVPFTGNSAAVVALKHTTAEVPLLPKSTRIFQDIIQIALAKDPDDRYQSGEELIEDIDLIRRDLPIELEKTILSSNPDVPAYRSNNSGITGPRSRRRTITPKPRRSRYHAVISNFRVVYFLIAFATVLIGNGAFYVYKRENQKTENDDFVANVEEQNSPSVKADNIGTPSLNTTSPVEINGDQIAAKYIDDARVALTERRLEDVRNYINQAKAQPNLSNSTQTTLSQIVAEWEAEEDGILQREINELVEKFHEQLAGQALYKPEKGNAHLTLTELRDKAPQYPDLLMMQRELDRATLKYFRNLMAQEKLDDATKLINRIKDDAPVLLVSQLNDELEALKSDRERNARKLESLRADAKILQKQYLDGRSTAQALIATYKQILALNKIDSAASSGLTATLDSELLRSREMLKLGQLEQARELVSYLRSQAPDLEDLSDTEKQLSELELRRRNAQQKMSSAIDLLEAAQHASPNEIDSFAAQSDQAKLLIEAFRAVFLAETTDPTLPGTDDLLKRIEREYSNRFFSYANKDNREMADLYFKALSTSGFTSPRITVLLKDFNAVLVSPEYEKHRSFSSF